MKYPCEIIKDLIPLYIDDCLSGESKRAVEGHFAECGRCKTYYETMLSEDIFIKGGNSEDEKMADSLKKVKTKINKKIKNIIVGAVSAVVIFTVGFQVLFNAPIRKIDKSKVKISAEVYPIEMLPHSLTADGDSVEISLGENDESDVCKVEIPAIPDAQMSISENAEEKSEFATVITTSSDYFLRTVKWEIKDDTIYISAFKTTILNNKAQSYQKNMTSIEFKEIRKIVFVENGTETVLWKK